jgi:hypothetical protein
MPREHPSSLNSTQLQKEQEEKLVFGNFWKRILLKCHLKINILEPDMAAHTCNSSYSGR